MISNDDRLMRSRRRTKAGILAVLILLVLSLSSVFELYEADHECIGSDCPVCEVLGVCEQFHALFEVVVTAAVSLTAASAVFTVIRRIAAVTPIISHRTLSVRLNC